MLTSTCEGQLHQIHNKRPPNLATRRTLAKTPSTVFSPLSAAELLVQSIPSLAYTEVPIPPELSDAINEIELRGNNGGSAVCNIDGANQSAFPNNARCPMTYDFIRHHPLLSRSFTLNPAQYPLTHRAPKQYHSSSSNTTIQTSSASIRLFTNQL